MRNGAREGTEGEGKYNVDSYEKPRSQMMWMSKIYVAVFLSLTRDHVRAKSINHHSFWPSEQG